MKTDRGSAFGQSAQALTTLAALTRQVIKQNGMEEDIDLLSEDRILERVAKTLARAGRLRRPFDVWMRNGPDSHIQVFFISLNARIIEMLDDPNCLPNGYRFANQKEMEYLLFDNRDILADEDDLIIVGQKNSRFVDNRFVILKVGGATSMHFPNGNIPQNTLFAVTYE